MSSRLEDERREYSGSGSFFEFKTGIEWFITDSVAFDFAFDILRTSATVEVDDSYYDDWEYDFTRMNYMPMIGIKVFLGDY